jgi:hypothetical protein
VQLVEGTLVGATAYITACLKNIIGLGCAPTLQMQRTLLQGELN